jgi:hypothetical protein
MFKSSRLIIAACICIGLGIAAGIAVAADADLQQYNGSPTFNADPASQSKLLPRDGKKIAADNNAAGVAPINRGLKQIVDIIIGLHDAVIGSRGGSTMRTLRALHVDATGGAASGASNGTAKISGDIISDAGSVLVNGATQFTRVGGAAAQRTYQTNAAVEWLSTAAAAITDANPPASASQINRLSAKNTPKAWVSLTTNGAGSYTLHDGFNVGTVAIGAAPNIVEIPFPGNFADTNYSCTISGSDASDTFSILYSHYIHADKLANQITITLKGNPTTAVMHIDVHCLGKQDS